MITVVNNKNHIPARELLSNVYIQDAIDNIRSKAKDGVVNLVCYCAPLSYHGNVLKQIIEGT